jgi:photosystem II stability/assembly factor-like uncharacterized protein
VDAGIQEAWNVAGVRCTVRFGVAACLIAIAVAVGQSAEAQRGRQQGAAPPKFKAVFEPINYPQDVELTDVHFVSAEEGWATGAAGTILHTVNGGVKWDAQLGGDPQSPDRAITQLRFAGARIGFAAQSTGSGDHRLYRTTDGSTWTPSGTVGQHRGDYQFTSADTGVYVSGPNIFQTGDGGKTWKPAYECAVSVQVEGLARQAACHFEAVHFPTPTIGYAISRIVEKTAFVVARTDDGGATWKARPVMEKVGAEYTVFTDANTGFTRMWGGTVYSTSDGGKTWAQVSGVELEGGKAAAIQFADRSLGWAVSPYGRLFFTVDGGRRWTSRQLKFPARISAFSLVARDHAYLVGEHGMAYRYRIVPADFKVPNMIDAPMMPEAIR